MDLKIQMLAGKGTKEFFERLYKNLTSLGPVTPLQKCLSFGGSNAYTPWTNYTDF